MLSGSLDGRGVWGRMDTCICMALHCLPEAATTLCVNGYVLMLSPFSCVRLCVTLWTVALQAPLSTGFSRQEYWSGVPLPSPSVPLERPKGCLGPREVGRLNLVGRIEPQKRGMEKSLWAQLPVDNLTVA